MRLSKKAHELMRLIEEDANLPPYETWAQDEDEADHEVIDALGFICTYIAEGREPALKSFSSALRYMKSLEDNGFLRAGKLRVNLTGLGVFLVAMGACNMVQTK